ncbi:MAG: hypothetical protein H7841_17805, partial [Magnetospirillum sp. WYHS-4]
MGNGNSKNLILAILLSFLIVFGYQMFFGPPVPPAPAPQQPTAEGPAPAAIPSPGAVTAVPAAPGEGMAA